MRGRKPSNSNQQPETSNQQPATSNQKPATSNQKPATSNQDMTDLSIIIVCYKGWDRLTKCLDSLDVFTGEKIKTEVIVVDNNSDDPEIFRIEEKYQHFKFIHNNINGGFANGCNLGTVNAEGKFFLFLNPDTVAMESEVEKLLETAVRNPDYGIVSCTQITENGRESVAIGKFPSFFNLTGIQRAIFSAHKFKTEENDIIYPDWISGSVVLIKRESFRQINGFDEDFWMYFEDVDLCKRVRNNNREIAFCRNITIEHNHGGSSRINLKTASLTKTEVHISRHVYISKHKKGIENILIQIFLVVNNIISAGIMALIGLVLFFIPKLFSRTLIFGRLINYYFMALIRISWISPRSVNNMNRSKHGKLKVS